MDANMGDQAIVMPVGDQVIDTLGLPEASPAPDQGDAATIESPQVIVAIPQLRFRTALLYSVAGVGTSLLGSLFSSAMPKYLDSYHLRPELIGLLATEQPVVGNLLAPIIGRLSDRTRTRLGRRRPYILAGVLILALLLLALGLHPPLAVMIILVALCGLGALATNPYYAWMADITPSRQRGQVGALLGVTALLGGLCFNAIAGLLWVRHEYVVFVVVASGLLITSGITVSTVREPTPSPQQPRRAANAPRYMRDLLRYRDLTRYLLVVALANLATGGVTPFIILYLTRALRVPTGAAFFLLLIVTASTAIGLIPAGLLGDRLGKKQVLTAGIALAAIGAFVAFPARSVGGIILPMILVGLTAACVGALNLPLLADLTPSRRTGELFGLYGLIAALCAAAGAVGAGHLVNSAHPFTYRYTFLWAGILNVCAVIALLTVRPERARAALAAEEVEQRA